jgi:hypothetical protein
MMEIAKIDQKTIRLYFQEGHVLQGCDGYPENLGLCIPSTSRNNLFR